MGNTHTQLRQHDGYQIISELPVGNIVKSNKNQALHFLKQYSYTSQQAYQNALNQYSLKLANKNEHILNFLHFTTKSQNSFCSTFYKILLIYEYLDYTLHQQIEVRIKENRPFTEKQMWSVLCSCVLAAVHLINTEESMHSALTSKDIRLTPTGCVKLLSQQMIGISPTHSIVEEGKPKTLAITLLHCFTLQQITNQDTSYLEDQVQSLDCSRDMKDMLLMMIQRQDIRFVQIEQQLFKLVQDDESIQSHGNTPILKTKSPTNSIYKCPKISRNEPNSQIKYCENSNTVETQNIRISSLELDRQEQPSNKFQFQCQVHELENPDETDEDYQSEQNQYQNENPNHFEEYKDQNNPSGYGSNHNFSAHNHSSSYLGDQLREISNNYMTASYKIASNDEKPVQLKKLHPVEQLNTNYNQQNNFYRSQNPHKSKNDQSLFTDPKLFSMIKSDLKEIQMRKSIQNNRSHQSNFSESKSINEASRDDANSSQQFFDKYAHPTVNDNTSFKTIEMIRQSSQQYRDEEECESATRAFKKNLYPKNQQPRKEKQIKNEVYERYGSSLNLNQAEIQTSKPPNIMYDEEQGFKKKRTTDRQSINENVQQPQNHPTFNPSELSTVPMRELTQEKIIHVTENYQKGKYTGTKVNGKRHGHGTFYYSEGGKYVGNWQQNKMHGYGVLYYPNSEVAYEGNWEGDQLTGWGVLYNQQVVKLRNPFDYRDWTLMDDYWIKYEGEFNKDNKQGKGKLYLSNGQVFEGYFADDMVNGQGTLFRDDGSTVKGKWEYNKLIKLF